MNGVSGIGIDTSNAVQDLTIACPVSVISTQAWAIGSGRNVQMKNAVFISAPFTIVGPGSTRINTMEGEGIYPIDFTGSSFTQIGPVGGDLSFQVDGSATLALTGNNSCTGPVTVNHGTLQLQSTDSNTVAGVCSALGTGPVKLGDGATVQLFADSNTVFGAGTTVTASNATVNINADALTPGKTGQIMSFASGGWNLGNVTLNAAGTNAILSVGTVTMLDGRITFTGPGTTHIHGINKDGIYPVDFVGSSYGSPSEIEWSFDYNSKSDLCGPIAGISGLNKGGTNKTLVLWGTNSYAGPTTITGGALVLAGDNSAVTNKTVVSGPATLALVANSGNTRSGVCSALGSTELDLTNGATVQLIADSNTVFGAGTTVTASNATVTISAGPFTPGQTNQTLSFAGGGLKLSNANINVSNKDDILEVGSITYSGSFQIGGAGRKDIGGIHGDGIYPVDYTGSSYGTPSEYEWAPGCTCGPIANTGGLNKLGNDVLVLTGTNTYTGPTTISNGVLVVKGSLSTGPVYVNGGILAGNGTINGPVRDYPGEGIYPVDYTGSSYGNTTLTINNTFTMQGTVTLCITKTGGTRSSDRIAGVTTANYGGALVVTNVTSDGTALTSGDTFTLFSAAHYANSFATVNLPPLNPGLAWDTSKLSVNGSISVVTVPPANISVQTGGGGSLSLNWPANQGWILQQTTNLSASWNDVVTTTNSYQVIPVPTLPGQFYRLILLGP